MIKAHLVARAAWLGAVVFVAGCSDGDDSNANGGQPTAVSAPEKQKFVQTWGTAAAGTVSTTATLPYFPSIANQTTGVTAPGVAVTPAIAPPAGTTTTAAIFANATIRQFFHVSLAGTTARVRLSNADSTADLRIDEAHIALADRAACQPPSVPVVPATAPRGPTCSNIVASTDRRLTVNGSTSFTIAKGQDVYTDAVQIVVPPLGDVAVSFYVKNPTPPLTVHALGFATAYWAVGLPGTTANYTAATAFDARTIGGQAALATGTNIVVATGIDVTAPERTRAIVGFGDSITDGANTVTDTSTRWTDVLAARFEALTLIDGKPQVAVSHAGISANKVASDHANPQSGVAGTTRFNRDVLSRSGVTDVIVLEGINDIGQPAVPATSATIIAGYRELIRQARAAGVKIYFATVTPIRTDLATSNGTYGGLFTPTAATFALREPVRQEVNAWITSTKEHDGFFDFNAAVSAPGRPNQMAAQNNITYTNGTYDQLHPNAAGLALMAGTVDLTLFR